MVDWTVILAGLSVDSSHSGNRIAWVHFLSILVFLLCIIGSARDGRRSEVVAPLATFLHEGILKDYGGRFDCHIVLSIKKTAKMTGHCRNDHRDYLLKKMVFGFVIIWIDGESKSLVIDENLYRVFRTFYTTLTDLCVMTKKKSYLLFQWQNRAQSPKPFYTAPALLTRGGWYWASRKSTLLRCIVCLQNISHSYLG